MREAAKSIFITTQMMMLHTKDLLDLRIIESGSFVPTYSSADVYETITEVVRMVSFSMSDIQLQISFKRPDFS